MDISNYHKYFTKWNVKTSTSTTDLFGAIEVGEEVKEIEGYLSKGLTTTRSANNIPITVSGGILFTDSDVILVTGDILNNQYQVIDYDHHASHNEYSVKLLDKWGDNSTPRPI